MTLQEFILARCLDDEQAWADSVSRYAARTGQDPQQVAIEWMCTEDESARRARVEIATKRQSVALIEEAVAEHTMDWETAEALLRTFALTFADHPDYETAVRHGSATALVSQ